MIYQLRLRTVLQFDSTPKISAINFSTGPGVRGVQPAARGADQVPEPGRRRAGKHHQLRGRGRRRGRHDGLRHHAAADPHRGPRPRPPQPPQTESSL